MYASAESEVRTNDSGRAFIGKFTQNQDSKMFVKSQPAPTTATRHSLGNLQQTRTLQYVSTFTMKYASTCTNNSKAAHEEEEGGEQRRTTLVGFRVI